MQTPVSGVKVLRFIHQPYPLPMTCMGTYVCTVNVQHNPGRNDHSFKTSLEEHINSI